MDAKTDEADEDEMNDKVKVEVVGETQKKIAADKNAALVKSISQLYHNAESLKSAIDVLIFELKLVEEDMVKGALCILPEKGKTVANKKKKDEEEEGANKKKKDEEEAPEGEEGATKNEENNNTDERESVDGERGETVTPSEPGANKNDENNNTDERDLVVPPNTNTAVGGRSRKRSKLRKYHFRRAKSKKSMI